MGFYIDLKVFNEKDEEIDCIQKDIKGGLGKAIYLFGPQSFIFDREEMAFFCKISIKDAIANLMTVKERIENAIDSGNYYDDWSTTTLNMHLRSAKIGIKRLRHYEDTDYVFANMSEALLCYNESDLDNFNANDSYDSAMRFLNDILSGAFNNYFLSESMLAKAGFVFNELEKALKKEFPTIVLLQDYGHIACLTMGKTKVLQFKAYIAFERLSKDYDDDFFVDSMEYLLPVFAFLQKRNIHMTQTFEKSITDSCKREFKVIFNFDASNW